MKSRSPKQSIAGDVEKEQRKTRRKKKLPVNCQIESSRNPVSRRSAMAFPLPRGLTPPEIAFVAEMEQVTVVPRQRLEGLELLSVSLLRLVLFV